MILPIKFQPEIQEEKFRKNNIDRFYYIDIFFNIICAN